MHALSVFPRLVTLAFEDSMYSKSPRIRNSVFANQAVQFLVHETLFQIEAGWFLKCHIRKLTHPSRFLLSRTILSCYFITLINA